MASVTEGIFQVYRKEILDLHVQGKPPGDIYDILLASNRAEFEARGRKRESGVRSIKRNLQNLQGAKEVKTASITTSIENHHDKIKSLLRKRDTYTITELSNVLDISPARVEAAISELQSTGHTIKVEGNIVLFSNIIPKAEDKILSVEKMSTGFYRFGACGDNHLGSRYERLDVLHALYDHFQKEGITTVYNTGNWIDGEARFNKHDLHTHGMDNQIAYFLKNYPQREGLTTYYITGDDHEGWYTQREGIDVGRYTQMKAQDAGRTDLVYLGHMEADIILKAPKGETRLRVLHPGGGSAYAISYTSQKIVESYTGNEKPHILLDGHYHKAGYNYIRGVHVVQTATTQDQSPFMRKKRLAAHLGGWIIEFSTDDTGAITRFKQEFIPFYDNQYYEKWEYKWK